MGNKKRKCRECKEFVIASEGVKFPVGFFCTYEHAMWFAESKTSKAKLAAAKKLTKEKDKAARVQHKKDKESIKPKAKWLAELQSLVNKYVRLRDVKDGCISCNKDEFWTGQWHASHLHSRGHSSRLRFNLWNIHKSCSVCNSHLSGNIGEYTPRLIEKIGQERYDWLTANKSKPTSYEIEYIKRAIKITRKAIKREERKW